MPIRPPACQALRPMVFARRCVPPKFVKGALNADTMGGHPRKTYASVHEALDDVFKPILVTLSDHQTKNGCSELTPLLPKYILFRVMLGMWRPRMVAACGSPRHCVTTRDLPPFLAARSTIVSTGTPTAVVQTF